MDIDDALVYLSKINKSNIHKTEHFNLRVQHRKKHIPHDTNELYSIILNEKPVSISKQDDSKFKLGYELNEDYDLTIIVSIKTQKSLTINLVTCYIEQAKKRMRKDG
ncbi:MAG: hypothetical protein MIO93_00420 [ANME-2 cluster archaeon]|nr:hypothetical protein [ANME-2 cluster archaeon]